MSNTHINSTLQLFHCKNRGSAPMPIDMARAWYNTIAVTNAKQNTNVQRRYVGCGIHVSFSRRPYFVHAKNAFAKWRTLTLQTRRYLADVVGQVSLGSLFNLTSYANYSKIDDCKQNYKHIEDFNVNRNNF